ncbi:MAG: winged helix-turn-helix domain-containing protein, partial [Pseudomonadota bacterium]
IRHEGTGSAQAILNEPPDLVVLDLMLPGEDGLSICRKIRTESDIPIIMVTARIDEIDRLLGLELGADDYLCKPFSPRELVLRVRALLRRSTLVPPSAATLKHQQIVLDRERHTCVVRGLPLELTPVEFRMLEAMMIRPGRVLSRSQLMDVAYQDHRVVSDRTIDSHMRNLRQKLGDGDDSREVAGSLIRSVYGVGYSLN